MSEKDVKQVLHRSRTSDSIVVDNGIKPPNTNQKQQVRMRKSTSLDSGEKDEVTNSTSDPTGPFQRRTFTVVRRRTSKRKSKPEPEFGHDTEAYEKIRERVLQERAVTNAIDALQERWRMIMLMYGDCVDLNNKRMERKLRKLCVRRQFEMIVIAAIFFLICLPIIIVFIFVTFYM
ncbi:uncharacterized protein LOC132719982 [Ruditapes philippinarum]|uniref:uncharacterized protein LOC132719982 n=1 Tax=Ruditapes philippinarum TaxID=129788 RepID=UPI00295AAFC5|nr:uncharacterized protein LOC132719982 [Ruditapes philippinarum]